MYQNNQVMQPIILMICMCGKYLIFKPVYKWNIFPTHSNHGGQEHSKVHQIEPALFCSNMSFWFAFGAKVLDKEIMR